MKKKNHKNYITVLIDNSPNISSGRKNYDKFDKRIDKNIYLTKKMIKSKDINEFIINRKIKKVKNI